MDPTFEKKLDPDPIFEKTPDPDPTNITVSGFEILIVSHIATQSTVSLDNLG